MTAENRITAGTKLDYCKKFHSGVCKLYSVCMVWEHTVSVIFYLLIYLVFYFATSLYICIYICVCVGDVLCEYLYICLVLKIK